LNQTLVHYLQANLKKVSTTDNKFVQHYSRLGETFPQFKTGSYSRADGTISYNDFGQELCLFLPDWVLCFRSASIRPIHFGFSFKLFELQRLDQDGDGIPSYLEDLDGDGYIAEY
jgi:hypothetical protein